LPCSCHHLLKQVTCLVKICLKIQKDVTLEMESLVMARILNDCSYYRRHKYAS
jgi:hypothetical protein